MNSELVFSWMVFFLCVDFAGERLLDYLNRRAMSPGLPEALKGIYEEKEYRRFLNYKKDTGRLAFWESLLSFGGMLCFLLAGGFGWYNRWIVGLTPSVVWQTLWFMLGLGLVSFVFSLPFGIYSTFRIEEKYGFNRTTVKTYVGDTLKGAFLSLLIGGLLLALVTAFYLWTGPWFWVYAWGGLTLFSLLMMLFYSQLIVPLFNQQVPLEAGSLREKIERFAGEAGFRLQNIYVMDGSKRSTKANAYFTGMGPKKRVVLYDTLLKELTEEEVVAVLAHEIGHYRKHHTLQMMIASVIQTGVILWLFSLFVNRPELSVALGAEQNYFQLGLIAFALLYSPLSTVLGIGMNIWSRKNEYEADAFAAQYYDGRSLVSGLKKISVKALSNLTPYPLYEFVYYSHPCLLKRMRALERWESGKGLYVIEDGTENTEGKSIL